MSGLPFPNSSFEYVVRAPPLPVSCGAAPNSKEEEKASTLSTRQRHFPGTERTLSTTRTTDWPVLLFTPDRVDILHTCKKAPYTRRCCSTSIFTHPKRREEEEDRSRSRLDDGLRKRTAPTDLPCAAPPCPWRRWWSCRRPRPWQPRSLRPRPPQGPCRQNGASGEVSGG